MELFIGLWLRTQFWQQGKLHTVKAVLSDHSKIDKTKVLKPCGNFMQAKSTAEYSIGAFHGAFCNNF